jgi:hypothetical protein
VGVLSHLTRLHAASMYDTKPSIQKVNHVFGRDMLQLPAPFGVAKLPLGIGVGVELSPFADWRRLAESWGACDSASIALAQFMIDCARGLTSRTSKPASVKLRFLSALLLGAACFFFFFTGRFSPGVKTSSGRAKLVTC